MKEMKLPLIIGAFALTVAVGTGMYINDSGMHVNNSAMQVSSFTGYLEDPAACNNCHVMDAAYEGWYHGDHKNRATCIECHLPQDTVPKYIEKARSGLRDVTTFISGSAPDAIRTTESSKEIIAQNCIRCHAQAVENIIYSKTGSERYCFDCHRTVAHGERGISLLPDQEGR